MQPEPEAARLSPVPAPGKCSGGCPEDATELQPRLLLRLLAGLAASLLLVEDLRRPPGDLGELGLELADLTRSPDGRAEPVMSDRGHHEESRVGRVNAPVQPVSSLHAISLSVPSPASGTPACTLP